MKGKLSKIISFCLCMAILAGGAIYAFASNDDKAAEQLIKNEQKDASEKQQEIDVQKNYYKDETVYVLAKADGTVEKIIVSDWIKNSLSNDKIYDMSELQNIENIKGDEEYILGGDNSLVWDAQGKDIYYRGTIKKELPVSLSVSYKLDGHELSPDELAGKSGRVTIRFDYKNRQYETVKINGKDVKIYVPYLMMTGMVLDNDRFSNIELSNGKIINDGDRTVVIGFALPGLAESLDIDDYKLEIPSYVELTADVSDFSLGMTITLATNTLFSKIDTEKINSISDLKDEMSELDDAMTKLTDGSSELYNGLCTLLDKSSDLVDGIKQLADGAAKLKEGAYSLDDGAKQLSAGAASLANGLKTLSANNEKLTGGARQVFETILDTAENQLKAAGLSVPELTIDNYASVLNGIIDSLDETNLYNQALKQVTDAVEAKRDYIKSQVAEAVRAEVEEKVRAAVLEQVREKVIQAVKEEVTSKVAAAIRENVQAEVIYAASGMDKEGYDNAVKAGLVNKATQDAIEKAVEEKMASEEIKAMISSRTDEQMQSEELAAIISQKLDEQMQTEQVRNHISANTDKKMAENDILTLIEQNTELQIQKAISENMAGEEVQAKLAAASEGAKSVISLKASLDDYNSFYLGLMDYTSAVAQAAGGASALSSGADKLKDGTAALYDGVSSLYDGILTMKDGTPALVDGITRLKDGAMRLSDGLSRFSEEGISKLLDTADDAEALVERFKAVVNVSKNYKAFAGISDDEDGSVKFIYRTDEIKAEKAE